jgi:adenylosuccinate lyase
MMREAKKMMADPVFQEQCKQYTENEAFQAHLAKTKADLQDATKVKEIEEQMKLRVAAGEKELTELLAQSTLLHNDTTTADNAEDDDNKQSTEASDELKVRNYDSILCM